MAEQQQQYMSIGYRKSIAVYQIMSVFYSLKLSTKAIPKKKKYKKVKWLSEKVLQIAEKSREM